MKLVYPHDDSDFNFSIGWLGKFKHRHGIKSFRRFGESGSVDVQDMEKKLVSIREKIDQFPMKDIFNMDETGLFYRLQADHSLATKQLEGRKQDKERLTVVICCNEDGSKKIPLWIIGKYAKPRCFKNVNMNSLDSHPRNIEGLRNVELFFLPPNMTSKIQPCDAGIIRAFKMHYRRSLDIDVRKETIANCFRHCKIRSASDLARNLDESTFDEETHDLETMINQCGYCNKMDIDNLMNYPGENEACSEVQSLEDIVGTIIENNAEDDSEDDTVSLEPVTRKEALITSNTLHNFMIQYTNTTPELLDAIRKSLNLALWFDSFTIASTTIKQLPFSTQGQTDTLVRVQFAMARRRLPSSLASVIVAQQNYHGSVDFGVTMVARFRYKYGVLHSKKVCHLSFGVLHSCSL
ncbi:CENP-B 2 [Glycine max]|nr:CENP-B 2 [Glycine max]